MRLLNMLTLGGLCFLCNQTILAQESITYKNQRGSVLTLQWHKREDNTGTLTGTFTTAVGNCKQDMGVPVPVTGFYNGNSMALAINFPHCKQVVAMTGHFIDQNNELATLWLDAKQSDDPQRSNWEANICGADYYKKQK